MVFVTCERPTQAIRLAYVAAFQIPRVPETLLSVGDFAALTGGMRRSARPGSFTEAHFVRYREAWSRPGAMTAMLNWYRALLRRNPATPATVVTPPVRIIWGDRDDVLERRLAEAALALCTQGEVFHLPDATHWVQHDSPGEVNELLLQFLDAAHV